MFRHAGKKIRVLAYIKMVCWIMIALSLAGSLAYAYGERFGDYQWLMFIGILLAVIAIGYISSLFLCAVGDVVSSYERIALAVEKMAREKTAFASSQFIPPDYNYNYDTNDEYEMEDGQDELEQK